MNTFFPLSSARLQYFHKRNNRNSKTFLQLPAPFEKFILSSVTVGSAIWVLRYENHRYGFDFDAENGYLGAFAIADKAAQHAHSVLAAKTKYLLEQGLVGKDQTGDFVDATAYEIEQTWYAKSGQYPERWMRLKWEMVKIIT